MGVKFAVFWLALMACAGAAAADDDAQASIGDTRLTAGDDVQIDSPVRGNAFAAGARVGVTARIDRSAWLSGGDVTVSAPVGRNLYMAGGDLRLESVVYGGLRAAGGNVRVVRDALVDGSASLAGGSIEVDGGIGRDLRAYGESIVINGVINGDVELAGERIRIGPDARIAGKVEYRSGRPIVIDPEATIGRGITEMQKERRWMRSIGRGTTIMGTTFSFGLVLIGALMLLGLPRFTRESAAKLRSRPAVAAGVGCVMLLGVPLMILLLVLTIIGIPLALLFAFGYVALMLFGYLIAAIFVGDTVLERLSPAKAQAVGWRILFLLLALVVIAIVRQIPFVGGVVVALLFVAGIGAFTMRAWQGFRRDTDQAPATA
jgi:cytoskeletal protein CcmA (bactofilin family)